MLNYGDRQMKDLGITCVLLGHSERRGEFGIHQMVHLSDKPGGFRFLANFLTQTGSWEPSRCVGIAEIIIAGLTLKAKFGRVFVENVYFSFKFEPPSATYPFLGPLILEDCFRNASTRFGACFPFRTRLSNLLSHSQSLPNHEFSKSG